MNVALCSLLFLYPVCPPLHLQSFLPSLTSLSFAVSSLHLHPATASPALPPPHRLTSITFPHLSLSHLLLLFVPRPVHPVTSPRFCFTDPKNKTATTKRIYIPHIFITPWQKRSGWPLSARTVNTSERYQSRSEKKNEDTTAEPLFSLLLPLPVCPL